MQKKNPWLEPYEPIVDFLADFLGENTEVVLHDFCDLERSVYKLRNGHLSGRKVGDPITDLVARTIKEGATGTPYRCNYKSKSQDNKRMKSATYFIHDDKNRLVGAMCINMMVEDLYKTLEAFGRYLRPFIGSMQHLGSDTPEEHLGFSIPEMVDLKLDLYLPKDTDAHQLSNSQKVKIISALNDEGVFLLKGSVAKVAKRLDMAEQTLYRHIQKLKNE